MGYKFCSLELDGAYLIENFSVGDARGRFTKCYEKEIYKGAGVDFSLDETFVSVSSKNVIRGLHFQLNNPQSKLVCVIHGKVWDVIVDLRVTSPTFKQWFATELSADNHKALFVPRGFAHGFWSMEDNTCMLYQCDGKYDKETDTGILYNDSDIGIDWPVVGDEIVLSEKDSNLMTVKEYMNNPMMVNV